MDYSGKYALITGASSGIGVAIAEEFAHRGAHLILVARRKDRLEQVAHNMTTQYGVTAHVVAQDLTAVGAVAALAKKISALKVDVEFLINNAGFGINSYFVDEDRSITQQEITLNVSVLVDLTAQYLPQMLQRNSGAVVNIASTASFQPVPGMAVYGATKAFVRSFTEAVWGELGNSRVRVLAVSPGSTESEFFIVAGGTPGGKAVPAHDVAKKLCAALDSSSSRPSVVVGGANAFTAKLVGIFPKKFVIKTVGKMFLPKKG